METNHFETNQLDSDSHLPPRKRLLNGFKKLNASSNGSSPSPSPSAFASSSSSTSNSNGSSSSSASTNVKTHVDILLASSFNNGQNQSPEELVEAARSAAALAVKAAKAARAMANEKALISAKAIAAAKRALELVDSFAMSNVADSKERSPKKKKHVQVNLLYSKGHIRDDEDDLDIDNKYSKTSRRYSSFEENNQRNKKHKKHKNVVEGGSSSIVTTPMNDIVEMMDSDTSYEGLESNRKAIKPDEADSKAVKEKAREEYNSLGKRRGRMKLKKLPLSICNSRNQENVASSGSQLPVVAQPPDDGVTHVVIPPGPSSWKCHDLKAPECVKQNKAVRS